VNKEFSKTRKLKCSNQKLSLHFLEGRRKPLNGLSQNSRYPDWDLTLGLPNTVVGTVFRPRAGRYRNQSSIPGMVVIFIYSLKLLDRFLAPISFLLNG